MLRIFNENLMLKIAALVISISIWWYVGRNTSTIEKRRVHAEIKTVGKAPDNLFVQIRQDAIPVEVTGPKEEVMSIDDQPDSPLADTLQGKSKNTVKVLVDLSTAKANMPRLTIVGYEKPPLSPRINYKGTRQYVNAEVEVKRSKRLPVKPSFNYHPPFGKRFGNPRLNPETATAIGTEENLAQVDKLVIYIDTQSGAIKDELPIKAIDKKGVVLESVQIEPATAQVEVPLLDAEGSSTLIVTPKYKGEIAYPHELSEITIEPSKVNVTGKPEVLAGLTTLSTAELDLEGIKSDTVREVALLPPPGVTVTNKGVTVTNKQAFFKEGQPYVLITIKVHTLTVKPPAPDTKGGT